MTARTRTGTGTSTGSGTGSRASHRAAPGPAGGRARTSTTTGGRSGGGRSGRSTGGGSGRGSGRGSGGGHSGRDRFEARRLAVERHQGLCRLRLVFGLAAVTSLAVGVVAFINSSWFDVDDITVVGNDRASADGIVEASGIQVGQGLLEVEADRAARAVELVPWVGTAEVSRSWTGSIEIAVVERPASAVIPAAGGFALVDDHGRQLEIVDRRPEGYLPIRGIEGSGVAGEPAPDTVLPVVALVEALPDDLTARIQAVVVRGGEIHLELRGGGRANLGEGRDLGPKLQAFETVLARVDLSCLDTIDVRVPAAPVVTRTADLEPLGADGGDVGGSEASSEEPDSVPVDC